MIIDVIYQGKSPVVPYLGLKFHFSTLPDSLVKDLAEIIYLVEPDILKNNKPKADRDPKWLTAYLWNYNLFNYDYKSLKILKTIIAQEYHQYLKELNIKEEPAYIHGWANILRTGRDIGKHHHADAHCEAPEEYAHISGNICIHAENTKTHYISPFIRTMSASLQNNIGDIVLFPSWVEHATDKNPSSTPRLSLAFDIITETVYNMVDTKLFVPLT